MIVFKLFFCSLSKWQHFRNVLHEIESLASVTPNELGNGKICYGLFVAPDACTSILIFTRRWHRWRRASSSTRRLAVATAGRYHRAAGSHYTAPSRSPSSQTNRTPRRRSLQEPTNSSTLVRTYNQYFNIINIIPIIIFALKPPC